MLWPVPDRPLSYQNHHPNDYTRTVKTMTRQELDALMLDYLYDELDAAERARYEAALPAHPEVAQLVVEHRATRARFAALPPVTMQAGLMERVLAEARGASAGGAVPPRASARGGGAKAGWLARLARAFAQPAFATAAIALLFVGIGVGLLGRDDLARDVDSQRLDGAPVVEAPARVSGDRDEGVPAREVAPAPEPPAPEVAGMADDFAGSAASADIEVSEEAVAAPKPEEAKSEASAPTARRPAIKPAADKAKKDAVRSRPTTESGRKRPRRTGVGGGAGGSAGVTLGALDGPADGAATGAAGGLADKASENKGNPYSDSAARGGAPRTGGGGSALDLMRGGGQPGPSNEAPETAERFEAVTVSKRVAEAETDSELEDERAPAPVERAAKTDDDASRKALSKKDTRSLREAALWERYRELVEADELDEAERVLAELEKLRGDSVATRKARSGLADRRERKQQAGEQAAPPPAETLDSFD